MPAPLLTGRQAAPGQAGNQAPRQKIPAIPGVPAAALALLVLLLLGALEPPLVLLQAAPAAHPAAAS